MTGTLISVALGGAIGSVLRYLAGLGALRVFGSGFPMGVLSVNIFGSLLMGLFVVWAGQKGMSHLNPAIAVGFLGGFTTFSAFSLEAVTLFERGAVGQAAVYIALSVVVSITALLLGVWLMRMVLA